MLIIIIINNNNDDDTLCLSVDVFCTKVLMGDTIFMSPSGDGAAILLDHLNHTKFLPFAERTLYLYLNPQ